MKALRVLAAIVAVLLVLGAVGCALGAIWTDDPGRVDPLSWHLWDTAFVLFILAIPAGAVAVAAVAS